MQGRAKTAGVDREARIEEETNGQNTEGAEEMTHKP